MMFHRHEISPKIREKSKIEILIVDFYKVDTGLLYFKITVGQQTYKDSFSHIFDPLLDLKYWLEAISIGVQQTSFQYDNEGDDIKFDFERVYGGEEVLIISEAYEDGEIFIKANINRQQMVLDKNHFYIYPHIFKAYFKKSITAIGRCRNNANWDDTI